MSYRVVGADSMPLLFTKLHRPRAGPDIEPRTVLLERLDRNVHRSLTLISAPAGYGKTTLASMWLQASDRASAWVSLDERDDDLITFATYLVTSVQGIFPVLGLKTQALLQAPVAPSATTVARYLMNDLEQVNDRFILALDDIHLVTQPAIFDLLAELLRHPSPAMHLMLIGRWDPPLPIASMRARGQVTEIRARDLIFTVAETARLLERMLQRDIDDETAAEWVRRTEGWVTALRLGALALQHSTQPDDLTLSVPRSIAHVNEYLMADVVQHLPPVEREALLQVSLLDRFCPPLWAAVCRAEPLLGTSELMEQDFVRRLQESNLFLVSLDDQGHWFRFHHLFQSLLQELVRAEKTPDTIAAIYLRASAWCAENELWDDAIQYSLAAGDGAAAAQLVERQRYALMNAEQWKHLSVWLRLLPAEVVARRPLLSNAKAFLAQQMGEERDLIAAQQQSDRLLTGGHGATMGGMAAEELQVAQAELAVLRGVQHYILGQAAEAIASARSGMEQLPTEALHVRAIALAVIATSLQMEGDMARGARVMREALTDPAWPKSLRARLLHYLSVAYVMAGDLSGALEAGHQCLRTAESLRRAEAISYARYDLGVAHYLRYEWAASEGLLCALFEDRAVSAPVYVTFGAFALALIYQAQGRSQEAQRVIDLVSAYLLESEHDEHVMAQAITQAFRVELALRQGKLAQARRLSQGVQFDIHTPRWCFYMPQLTQCKLLLAEGSTASLAAARASLFELDGALDRLQRNHVRIDALALLALVHDALGQQGAALDALGAALRLAETGGFVHSFVDLGLPMAGLLAKLRSRLEAGCSAGLLVYLNQVLAAFPAPGLAAAASRGIPSGGLLAERLTERETEVLHLLARGLSPNEIARQLVVSLTTVRTHIRNIYAKLGVHSRMEAVQRAGELELL